MIVVREVLRRLRAGQSARKAARGLMDRKTVGRYFAAAKELGAEAAEELDDALVARVAAAVQSRPEPEASEQWLMLEAERDRINRWLHVDRYRLVRVHELLARDGVVVSYTLLREFAHKELQWRERKPTVLVEDPPFGEEAQVDFGLMGRLTVDGKVRKLWALIVTLSASRYTFVWPLLVQTTAALCEGLDAAWRFFDGVPKRVVVDNTTAAVVRPDPVTPGFQPAFMEYAQARGFFIDPARVRRPQDKARVENQVPYVRERCFDGEVFASLRDSRDHAERWSRDVAGTRVHGTTRKVPRDVYLEQEKPLMQPAPTSLFDVPIWSTAKVHLDHHVQVAKALYSVPSKYLGREVRVRSDRATVRLYVGSELIKTHRRVEPGKRSTDRTDYPDHKAVYAFRGIDELRDSARRRGAHVGAFVDHLLGGPLPWTKVRATHGLLRLCDKYGPARVDAYCEHAIGFEVFDVRRIEHMLKEAIAIESRAELDGKVRHLRPTERFSRPAEDFATRSSSANGGGSQ